MIRPKPMDQLLTLVAKEQLEEMDQFLQEQKDDFTEEMLQNAFFFALAEGCAKVVTYFLEKGMDIDAPSDIGEYPLLIAIEQGELELAKLLLEKGADPDVVDDFGESALFKSAIVGNQEFIEALIKHGASVNVTETMNGFTPLIAAVYNKQYQVVEFLLENKADGSIRAYEKSALEYMIELDTTEEKERMLDIFIQHKYQFDKKDQGYINQIRLKRIFELPEEEEDY